ncbi:hypothetical protein FRX31_016298 [Thalictrum thalictroides]|uniref:FKB95-like N-terminal Kelch domain-containing protein n=1 Tax=Thalictrum thalictroides TaxID=46969 RepID=A0A7J6W9K4_THATH|nr:hypothetical protein FRX31_016298 [Thalictrum thalictroides]
MEEEKSVYFLAPGKRAPGKRDEDDYDSCHKANHLYKINPSMNNNHSIIDLSSVCVLPSYIPNDNSFVSLDNKLYVIGGSTYVKKDASSYSYRNYTILHKDVFCMDMRSGFNGVWKRCSPMILGRRNPLTIAVNGLIYVFGSLDFLYSNQQVKPWAEVFDPLADTWSQLPQPLEKYQLYCNNSCIDYCNGKIFIGMDSKKVLSFDINDKTWKDWSVPFRYGFNSFAVVDQVMYFSCADGLYAYDLVNTSIFTGAVDGLKMLYKKRGFGDDYEPRGYVLNLGNGKLFLIEDGITCVKFGVRKNYDQHGRIFIRADVEASAMYCSYITGLVLM